MVRVVDGDAVVTHVHALDEQVQQISGIFRRRSFEVRCRILCVGLDANLVRDEVVGVDFLAEQTGLVRQAEGLLVDVLYAADDFRVGAVALVHWMYDLSFQFVAFHDGGFGTVKVVVGAT